MISNINPIRSTGVRKALVLALALPLATAGVLPALAQEDTGPSAVTTSDRGPDRDRMDRDRAERGDRLARGWDRHHGRDRDGGDRRWHREWSGERLAMRLAAAETAAGIKTAQLDAWRTFTAALVDFATPTRGRHGAGGAMEEDAAGGMPPEGAPPAPAPDNAAPPFGDAASAPPPPPPGDAMSAGRPDRAFRPGGPGAGRPSGLDMLDRMIMRVEDRAAKAEALKTAKADLETVLEPGQREIIERYLTPKRHGGKR